RYVSRQDDEDVGCGEGDRPVSVGTFVAAARLPLYADSLVLSPPCLTRLAPALSSSDVAPTGPGSGQTRASAETHCPGLDKMKRSNCSRNSRCPSTGARCLSSAALDAP